MFKVSKIFSISVIFLGLCLPYIHVKMAKASGIKSDALNIEIITTGLTTPYAIDIDNNGDLIVTVDGALIRIDQSGNVQTLTTLAPGVPSDAIVFGSDYIVVNPAQPPELASLLRVAQTGETTEIAEISGDPAGLAVQNNDFIVVDFNRVNNNPFVGNGRLLRVSQDGSSTSIIASENLGGSLEVFVDGENFWITDFTFGRLLFVSAHGDVTEIATGLGQPLDIEFDGRNFIITDFADGFNNPGNGRILQVSKSGEVENLISGIGNPSGITIQGSDLLFTDLVEGRIGRIQGILETKTVPESSSVLALLILGALGIGMIVKQQFKQ